MSGVGAAAAPWRCVHIHYADHQDELLAECVAPLVASARTRGLSRWFFLRYWRGGPHVRLRLRFEAGAPPGAWEDVLAGIGEHVRGKPSEARLNGERLEQEQRRLAALEGESAGEVVLHPDNTLVLSPYVPEYGKYGGPIGVALAEAFFEASSDTALDVLTGSGGSTKGRVNLAFAMMLAGLRAAGYADRGLVDLFAAWIRFCERFVPPGAWQALQAKMRQPDVRRQLGLATMASVEPDRYPPWLLRWAGTFGEAARALHEHAAVVRPAVTFAKSMDPLQFVLFHYLHTHNNRLGVTPALEAQIAYVGQRLVAHASSIEAGDVRA